MRDRKPWSVASEQDISARLGSAMPGRHPKYAIDQIYKSLSVKARRLITKQSPTYQVEALNSALLLHRCKVIFDPWAGHHAVRKGLKIGAARLCLNDRLGGADTHLALDPLEAAPYEAVIKTLGRLDAIVMAPPEPLFDIALVNAIDYANSVVCMLIDDLYLVCSYSARTNLLNQLERDGRLLIIMDVEPCRQYRWLCVFASHEDRARLVRDHHEHGDATYMFLKEGVVGSAF